MTSDKRAFKRHWAGEEFYKIFIPSHSLIGSVLDVGSGGLSFEYIPCYSIIGEGSDLDFYFHDGYRLHVPPLACKVIYDRPDRSKGSYYRIFEIRRCGAEFIDGETDVQSFLRKLILERDEDSNFTALKRKPDFFGDMPMTRLK
ncbi:MAG: hypothetical protein ACOWWM_01250 [Desulfobacterales bacterium]